MLYFYLSKKLLWFIDFDFLIFFVNYFYYNYLFLFLLFFEEDSIRIETSSVFLKNK